jgi:hypothetical protein
VTGRDRLVLLAVVVIAVLGAGWMLVVSPEREKAGKVETEVSTARAQLSAAQQQLSEAQGAQTQYTTAYASIVRLGKAVPASEEVPSLVYELDQASNEKNVEFNSIATGTSGSGSAGASSSSAAGASAASAAAFTQMPFTFVFNGTFANLSHLFSQLQGFALQSTAGEVQVSGRLLTIQSISLEAPSNGTSEEKVKGGAGAKPENAELKGAITATAYVLPSTEGLTGGATAAGPVSAGSATQTAAGTGASGAAAPSSSTPSSSSSPAPAALLQVKP